MSISRDPWLWGFLALTTAGQAYIGADVLRSPWGMVAYPAVSLALGSLYWLLPAWQLDASTPDRTSAGTQARRTSGHGENSAGVALLGVAGAALWGLFLAVPGPILPFVGWLGVWQNLAWAGVLTSVGVAAFGRDWQELLAGPRRAWLVAMVILVVYTGVAAAMGRGPAQWIGGLAENLQLAAAPEELVFRFVLLGGLLGVRGLPPIRATMLAALVFGLWHLPINIRTMGAEVGVIFCVCGNGYGGLLFGHLYRKTRSVPVLVVVHATINAIVGA